MAGVRGRKHRTGVAHYVRLTGRVDPEHAQLAERTASALGVSLSTYLDELLAREARQLDDRGRPSWWTEPIPADQEELPLKAG
jgi:hypothetical protein